jgi:hypothetical protein
MTEINETFLKDYVDRKFAETNASIANLSQQLVTVIQSLEVEVKRASSKDILIAQLRGEISALEKIAERNNRISFETEQSNAKRSVTSNPIYPVSLGRVSCVPETPSMFQFQLPTSREQTQQK